MKIVVDVKQQTLFLYDDDRLIQNYSVSTAKKGLGEKIGSFQTPCGMHEIYEKIGNDEPINAVFIARKPTGEIYSDALSEKYPGQDWILTRILWLTGCEPGKNQGGEVDTLNRTIYIHGAPDVCPMGKPYSHGCIRMHNKDIIELFDHIEVGMQVLIK